MKILQLIESAATGAGRHVADLTQGLLDRGHQVDLLYSPSRSDGVFADEVGKLASCPNFRASQIPMQRRPGFSDLRATQKLREYVRTHQPFDLVHCHSTKAGILGRAGLVGCGVRRVYTPHMFFSMNPEAGRIMRVVAVMEATMSTLGEGVVTVSPEERAHALKIGIKSRKVVLIPNGVNIKGAPLPDSEAAALRRTWGLGEGDVCIGFVGRLSLQKSPDTMLRAFAASPLGTRTPSRLIMVGDGPLDRSLRSLAADLGIAQRIVWLGARDARSLMPAFDIFALTSDSEGHPLVVLEAMACGLPIVATAVGGVPETVQHGVNGFITPVRGVNEIAAALETLVRNPEMRKRMGEASRVIVQDFSIDRMVDRTIAFYEEILSGSLAKGGASDLRVNSRSLKASAE